MLAQTAVRLLSKPIPIAIEGGLKVDRLMLPPKVSISSTTPLPDVVTDAVSFANKPPLTIGGPLTLLALQGTLQVKGDVQARAQVLSIDTPVTVEGAAFVQHHGKVTMDGKVKPTFFPISIK